MTPTAREFGFQRGGAVEGDGPATAKTQSTRATLRQLHGRAMPDRKLSWPPRGVFQRHKQP
jgi:hypothetical protein